MKKDESLSELIQQLKGRGLSTEIVAALALRF